MTWWDDHLILWSYKNVIWSYNITCVISPWRAIPAPDRTSRQAWKTNLSQKQGIRLYIHVMVRLIQWHSVVKLSLDVFQTYSSKAVIPYSAFVRPISITKLALFRDMDRKRKPWKRKPERQRQPGRTIPSLGWFAQVCVAAQVCVSGPCHGTEQAWSLI